MADETTIDIDDHIHPPPGKKIMVEDQPLDIGIIFRLAIRQCTDSEIASIMGVRTAAIATRCKGIVDLGRESGKAKLRFKQWEKAMAGSIEMLKWLGKQYLGQADKTEVADVSRDPAEIKVLLSTQEPVFEQPAPNAVSPGPDAAAPK